MIARHRRISIVTAVSAATISVCLAASNPAQLEAGDEPISTRDKSDRSSEPAPSAEPSINGNPLWMIPRESLTATRERPIFLPSRRPPPAVVARPSVELPKSLPPAPEAQRPALRLLGVVTGTKADVAIFISETTQKTIRLKMGEGHEGWVLQSVKAREVVLEKNRRSAVIELPAPMTDRK